MDLRPGDVVVRRDAPGEPGVVLELDVDPLDGAVSVLVRFGSVRKLCFPEDLGAAPRAPESPWEAIAAGRAGSAADLTNLLTSERLRRPMGAVGHAFGSARVKLFPYQFKLLVKLLGSPRQAVLIADEVGLGKTIEAGYILRELEERGASASALVLVPARLCGKWQAELAGKFHLHITVVDRATVRDQLSRAAAADGAPWRWIASYEGLRDRALIELIGEVGHAEAELEQLLARVAVAAVLLDGDGDGLLGQAVLQLEREHGQPLEEQAEVEGQRGPVAAVAELAGAAEPVGAEAPLGGGVARRGGATEQRDIVLAVLHPVAQQVDHAAGGDLVLEAGEELATGGAVCVQRKCRHQLGLGGEQEAAELRQVDAVFAVVVSRIAEQPARAARDRDRDRAVRHRVGRGELVGAPGHRPHEDGLEVLLGRVGGHGRLHNPRCPHRAPINSPSTGRWGPRGPR
jgi:hypothetical protein